MHGGHGAVGESARVNHGLVFVNKLFCLGNLFYIA